MTNATRITVSTFGGLMGASGIMHGVGEILQGGRPAEGLIFPSWPDAPFFAMFGGEPAMSILPNLLLTGVLAVLFSLAYTVVAIILVQQKRSGLLMILLSVAMLLFGGGVFPPVLAFCIGLLATRIGAVRAGPRPWLSSIWPWAFGICAASWLMLSPGLNILGHFFGVDNAGLTVATIVVAIASMVITSVAALARGSREAGMQLGTA